MLLGGAEGLRELLRVGLEGGDQVAVALLDHGPLRADVEALADRGHLVRPHGALELVLLHLHEHVPVLLDDHGGAVAEDYVEALEGRLLEVPQVAAQGAVDHVHQGALPVTVGGVHEVEPLPEVEAVVEFAEQAVDLDALDDHMRGLDAGGCS